MKGNFTKSRKNCCFFKGSFYFKITIKVKTKVILVLVLSRISNTILIYLLWCSLQKLRHRWCKLDRSYWEAGEKQTIRIHDFSGKEKRKSMNWSKIILTTYFAKWFIVRKPNHTIICRIIYTKLRLIIQNKLGLLTD